VRAARPAARHAGSRSTNLEIFRKAVQEDGLKPVPKGTRPDATRETYRAPHSRKKKA
jgi:hypothetical protein